MRTGFTQYPGHARMRNPPPIRRRNLSPPRRSATYPDPIHHGRGIRKHGPILGKSPSAFPHLVEVDGIITRRGPEGPLFSCSGRGKKRHAHRTREKAPILNETRKGIAILPCPQTTLKTPLRTRQTIDSYFPMHSGEENDREPTNRGERLNPIGLNPYPSDSLPDKLYKTITAPVPGAV